MARPALTDLVSGQQSWDATVNLNNDVITEGPFPPVQYATVTALLAVNAALYEDCLATTDDTHEVWASDGTSWRVVGHLGPLNNNGARGRDFTEANELTLSGADETWTGAFPAGSFDRAVSLRVTEVVTSGDGGTSFDVGDGSDQDRYAATVAFTNGTTKTPANATAAFDAGTAAAGNVVITCVGGTFSGGKVRLIVTYRTLTAPTS
jgi:hypothetical protein